jgi:uncharacterized protein (DUF169 family)
MSIFLQCTKEILKQVRPITSPLALKLLKRNDTIPKEAIRPKRDLVHRYSLCQAFSMSRRTEKVIAMLKEDMWCPEAIIGYGLVEPPKWFLDGRMWFSMDKDQHLFKDLEGCKNYGNSLPRFEVGKYIGVVSAPAMAAKFEPDLLLVYAKPGQIRRLVHASMYKNGKPISAEFYGGACLRAVVPAVKTGKCQVTIPCAAEWDISQDDEMIFSIPKEKMQDLILGLRSTSNSVRFPTNFLLVPEHELHPGYMHVRKTLESS